MTGGADERSAKLKAALERLAQIEEAWVETPEGHPARAVAASKPEDVVDALMGEIGDTVMPTRVILSGAVERVELAVAGRRVQGLLAASSEALGSHDDLVETILDAEEANSVAALGSVIDAVAKSEGPFTLRAETAARLGTESEPGLSPAQLRTAWSATATDGFTLEGFLQKVEPVIRGGILTRDREITLRVGDETLADPLVDVLEAAWPDFDVERRKVSRDHAEPSLTCWQQTDGPVVAVANWPENGVAALAFLPDAVPEVLTIWNTALKA